MADTTTTTTNKLGIKRRTKRQLNPKTSPLNHHHHHDPPPPTTTSNLQIIKDMQVIKKLKHKHRGLDSNTCNKPKDEYLSTSLSKLVDKDESAAESNNTFSFDVTPYSSCGLSTVTTTTTTTTTMKQEDKYLSSFTGINKTLDATKHMERYIEQEINKLKPQPRNGPGTNPKDAMSMYDDEQAQLYAVPDHLRVTSAKVIEGSVTASASMLTSIPEVDLGLESKYKAIQQTSALVDHHATTTDESLTVTKDLAFHNNPFPGMRWRISKRTRETLFDIQFADELVRDRKGRVGIGLCTNDTSLQRQIDLERRLGQVQGGKGVRSILEAMHSDGPIETMDDQGSSNQS